MNQYRVSSPNRCPVCRINYKLCICGNLISIENRTPVWIVMHHREHHLTSNTANLARLVLQNCLISERAETAQSTIPDLRLPGHLQLFLFPDEDAVVLDQEFMQKYPGPYQLIVPDGSWRQARKIKRREELFKNVMSVRLNPVQ